jgi:hypothetical protein
MAPNIVCSHARHHPKEDQVNLTTSSFGEKELSALNAKADVLAMRDANVWDEAVDWGLPDYHESCPLEWRLATAPEFD